MEDSSLEKNELDGLEIDYNEETGEIQLDWDGSDPRWSFLNDLTPDEIGDMIIESLKNRLDEDLSESPA